MNLLVDISSFLSLIISIILLVTVFQFSKTKKGVKILVLLLFITIVGANLLNFIDFYHGLIDGILGN